MELLVEYIQDSRAREVIFWTVIAVSLLGSTMDIIQFIQMINEWRRNGRKKTTRNCPSTRSKR